MKRTIEDSKTSTGKGFSRAVITNGFVFTAGTIHTTEEDELLEGSVEEKIHQIMRNLSSKLEEAGTNFDNVVRTRVYLRDIDDFSKIDDVYEGYFERDKYPAREVIEVSDLPRGADLEFVMTATL